MAESDCDPNELSNEAAEVAASRGVPFLVRADAATLVDVTAMAEPHKGLRCVRPSPTAWALTHCS